MAARTHEIAFSHRLRLFIIELFYSHVAARLEPQQADFLFLSKENFKC